MLRLDAPAGLPWLLAAQASATAANDDQVAVEAPRLFPGREDLVRPTHVDDLAREQRKNPEQGKRAQQAWRKNAGQRVDFR